MLKLRNLRIGQSDQNNSATVSKLVSQPATTGSLLRTPSWLPWCYVACHNFDLSCKTSDQIALSGVMLRASYSNYSYSNYSSILRYSNLEYFGPNTRTIRVPKNIANFSPISRKNAKDQRRLIEFQVSIN